MEEIRKMFKEKILKRKPFWVPIEEQEGVMKYLNDLDIPYKIDEFNYFIFDNDIRSKYITNSETPGIIVGNLTVLGNSKTTFNTNTKYRKTKMSKTADASNDELGVLHFKPSLKFIQAGLICNGVIVDKDENISLSIINPLSTTVSIMDEDKLPLLGSLVEIKYEKPIFIKLND